ncbi:MAG TPA: tetratricopeptide repeat protein [Bryobacteraceae bacterium]
MKAKKRETRKTATAAVVAKAPAAPLWTAGPRLYAILAAAAAALVFWVYWPAVHGPFLFDDTLLPFALPGFKEPLSVWLHNVRPVLFFTYWANAVVSGDDPFSYHIVNLIIHCITGGLVFLIVRRLVESAGVPFERRTLLAGFAAAIFLLHPVQTEAVAYLAGRSESLSVMLVFAAFTIFLYRRRTAVSWPVTAIVLALYGLAVLAKEHTIVLPALLLLTDYWWNPGFSLKGILRNWKIYALVALGGAAALYRFWGLLFYAPSAGFGLQDFKWYQYFFTQCRALFVYIREFLIPVGLRVDWDFPISYKITDHGAIAGLIVLIALAAAAFALRRRFPLATYGFFVYLLLMSPTSSILPIKDPIAERRLYFSILGLLLIVVDVLARVKIRRTALAYACVAVALCAAAATRVRAAVWSSAEALWTDNVAKSPNKARDRFQLAFAYYEAQRYSRAVAEFEQAAKLEAPDYNLLIDWGLAYDAVNEPDKALEKLRQAAAMEPTAHVYSQIAMVHAKRQQYTEALEALDKAQQIDSKYSRTYLYRGKVFLSTGRVQEAVQQYQLALAMNPELEEARQDLAMVQARLNGGR